MTIEEAIVARHSIRSYRKEPIAAEILEALREKISQVNAESGLHIQLITNEPKAFSGIMSYGTFHNVTNYLVMAGKKSEDLDERIGYYGEHLVLFAQTLGLNSCWVGLSYRKVSGTYQLAEGEKVVCVIALGYGEGQGRSHKVKSVDEVSSGVDLAPSWFRKGVEAALLAPTAINQQKFFFDLLSEKREGKKVVKVTTSFSMIGYTKLDMGIAKCHFEIGAGKDNFVWE